MIRMLIVGYCFGIRSERRLCEEVHLNLAYRWFCRLGLDGSVPDHSTFSKNRHGRFRDSEILRRLCETVLQRCIDERLVGGEGLCCRRQFDRRRNTKRPQPRRRCRGSTTGCGWPRGRRSIWPCSTMPLSVPRPRSRPSSSHRPIRQRAWIRRPPRAVLLLIFGQLPDRRRPRSHCGRRCDDGDPAGRGVGGQAHDRALTRRF